MSDYKRIVTNVKNRSNVIEISSDPNKKKFVFAMITFNNYINFHNIIESFTELKTDDMFTLVILDNGSVDMTLSYLEKLFIDNVNIIIIKNDSISYDDSLKVIDEIVSYMNYDHLVIMRDNFTLTKEIFYLDARKTMIIGDSHYYEPVEIKNRDKLNIDVNLGNDSPIFNKENIFFRHNINYHFKNELKHISMCSIPSRIETLEKVLSVKNQVDKIHIYLNNYDSIPSYLLDEKITIYQENDIGDMGKFYAVEKLNGYIFTIDDDNFIPESYIAYLIEKIHYYRKRNIVGLHGSVIKIDAKDYYNDRKVYSGFWELKEDKYVHILGTGFFGYHSSTITFKRNNFHYPNMADIWAGVICQRNKVGMVCVTHPTKWVKFDDNINNHKDTIWGNCHNMTENKMNTRKYQSKTIQYNSPFILYRSQSNKKVVVTGVTTYKRLDYFKDFVESYCKTISNEYHHILIVADDENGNEEKIKIVNQLDNVDVYFIKNNRTGVAYQTNTMLKLISQFHFDYMFKADDDIVFQKAGWDKLYIDAIEYSGYDHLCYQNSQYLRELANKNTSNGNFFVDHEPVYDQSNYCYSYINVRNANGCFFSVTPRVLQLVGYTDPISFPIRGEWHTDFSLRCCRANLNKEVSFFDAVHSNIYIKLQNELIDDYQPALQWDEYKDTRTKELIDKRRSVINDVTRLYIPFQNLKKEYTLNTYFDHIYLINLDKSKDRLEHVKNIFGKYNIEFDRYSAINGSLECYDEEYKKLIDVDLDNVKDLPYTLDYHIKYEHDLERVKYQLNRKKTMEKVMTRGAFGYLQSWKNIILDAMENNYRRILIFDDDILINKDYLELFNSAISQANDWYILKLGTCQYDWHRFVKFISDNLYQDQGTSVGTHAVGIDCRMYIPLLYYINTMKLPLDEGAIHKVMKVYNEMSYIVEPNIFIQQADESTIKSSEVHVNEKEKKDNIFRWNYELYE